MVKNTITFKVILILIVSVFLVFSSIVLMLYAYEKSRIDANLKNSAGQRAKGLVNNLVTPLWNFDQKEIEKIIYYEVQNPNFLAVIIYNYEQNEDRVMGKVKDQSGNILDYQNSQEVKSNLQKSFLVMRENIYHEKSELGRVEIYITDYFINLQLKQEITVIVCIAFILFITVLVIIFFSLKKIIIKPVVKIFNMIRDITNGNLDAQIAVKSHDEMGVLARDINIMAQSLKATQEYLEEIVTQRTDALNKANKELTETNKRMKRELNTAKKIQESIIPRILPDIANIQFKGFYNAMEELGGDYYDVFKISENHLGVVIADVSGHGTPSALITAMAKIAFANHAKEYQEPNKTIQMINREIYEVLAGSSYYLTAFYGIIHLDKNVLEFTNAGHNGAYILTDNKLKELKTKSSLIGIFENIDYDMNSIRLNVGDRLILYTDGIPEAKNKQREIFGKNRFEDIILMKKNLSAKNFAEEIINELNGYTENSNQADDQTLLIIDILTPKGKIDIGVKPEKTDRKQFSGTSMLVK